MMPTVLSTWKEIAQYMGKGVRTVQRWEQYFGLPIRRPNGNRHHAVLAIAEEIDAWVRQQAQPRNRQAADAELERLRRRMIALQEENKNLRIELLRRSGNSDTSDGSDRPVPIRQVI